MYGREERSINCFLWGHLREKDLLINLDVDARVILQLTYRKCYGSVDWIDVAQGRVKWASCCVFGNEP